jgi:uncharacterized SAM-binding protein YcdF (DUF218 family)
MMTQKKTKKLYDKAKGQVYDAIIVPGVPYPNPKTGIWDRVMKGRVYWAKHLFDQGITKHIIFSGGAVHSSYYEAKIMAQYAVAIGVPADVVFAEIKAEHSTENIYYSYHKGKNLGFKKIALATDPFQTDMTQYYLRKKIGLSKPLDVIPFVIDILKEMEPIMVDPEIDDQLSIDPNFVSIKEREPFRTRFRGTLGKNIDRTLYADGKIN